ncbi:FliM/FliN family flagellar motor switch protein [Variovorax saccharolyticus]|uniref:FliM/FliN family flagellar motor switch protein n=1 Tax=Variovorax saccharolyticus TaxID=3053516 RepID=UPI0025759071|nr:FliM/FliN family flagellar motor switch protein [Variovorax sp. J31P216]
MAGRTWQCRIEALGAKPHDARVMVFTVDDQRFTAAISELSLQCLLAEPLGGLAVQDVDRSLVWAMLNDVVGRAGSGVGLLAGCELALTASLADEAGEDLWLRVVLSSIEGLQLSLWLRCDDRLRVQLAPALMASDSAWPRIDELTWSGRMEFAWVTLPSHEVACLAVGDVILGGLRRRPQANGDMVLTFDTPHAGQKLALRLRGTEDGAAIAASGVQYMMEMPHETSDFDDASEQRERLFDGVDMDSGADAIDELPPASQEHREEPEEPEEPEEARDALALGGSLPVQMTFDLGCHSLTLEELRSVREGHVFELGLRSDRAVTVRVNGVPIATGEIVDIEGQLGVAITHLQREAR